MTRSLRDFALSVALPLITSCCFGQDVDHMSQLLILEKNTDTAYYKTVRRRLKPQARSIYHRFRQKHKHLSVPTETMLKAWECRNACPEVAARFDRLLKVKSERWGTHGMAPGGIDWVKAYRALTEAFPKSYEEVAVPLILEIIVRCDTKIQYREAMLEVASCSRKSIPILLHYQRCKATLSSKSRDLLAVNGRRRAGMKLGDLELAYSMKSVPSNIFKTDYSAAFLATSTPIDLKIAYDLTSDAALKISILRLLLDEEHGDEGLFNELILSEKDKVVAKYGLYLKWSSSETHDERKAAALAHDRIAGTDPKWEFGLDYPGKTIDPKIVKRVIGIRLKRAELKRQMWGWSRNERYFSRVKKDDGKANDCEAKRRKAAAALAITYEGMPNYGPQVEKGLAYLQEIDQLLAGKKKPIIETYADLWELSAMRIGYTEMLRSKTLKEFGEWEKRMRPYLFETRPSVYAMTMPNNERLDPEFYELVQSKIVESLKIRDTSPEEFGLHLASLFLCNEYRCELEMDDIVAKLNKKPLPKEKAARYVLMKALAERSDGAIVESYYDMEKARKLGMEYLRQVEDALAGRGGVKLKVWSAEDEKSAFAERHLGRYCWIAAVAREMMRVADYEFAMEIYFTHADERRDPVLPDPRNLNLKDDVHWRYDKLRKAYLKRIQAEGK